MNKHTILLAMVLTCIMAFPSAVSFANGPVQHSSQKHVTQKGGKCSDCGHHPHCFWDFWKHCKPHHPPYLPVVQSQAMQVSPPVSDALQMRLQVEKNQLPSPPPREGDQGGASQKPSAAQRTTFHSANYESIDQRFNRLERRVDVLIDKMDEMIRRDSGIPNRAARTAEGSLDNVLIR